MTHMFDQKTLAIITKVGVIAAILFVAVPAVIWASIKFIKYLSWAGGL